MKLLTTIHRLFVGHSPSTEHAFTDPDWPMDCPDMHLVRLTGNPAAEADWPAANPSWLRAAAVAGVCLAGALGGGCEVLNNPAFWSAMNDGLQSSSPARYSALADPSFASYPAEPFAYERDSDGSEWESR